MDIEKAVADYAARPDMAQAVNELHTLGGHH